MLSNPNQSIIDGRLFEAAWHPADEAAVAELLTRNHPSKKAVIPVGGGTQLHLGNPPRCSGNLLHLSALSRVVAHEADDMLVTVQAGCPLGLLQETLGKGQQWIPMDLPGDPRATIGGLIATNSYGPLRLKHGRLRDYILGMRVVQADGTITKAGGRVVKNVTGYDLCRLYAGSLGWLGVFTEFHLKTLPLPEAQKDLWILGSDLRRLQEVGQKILDEGLDPSGQILTKTATGYLLAARFTGHPATVDWQMTHICDWIPGLDGLSAEQPSLEQAASCWQDAVSICSPSEAGRDQVILKIVAPYGQLPSLVEEAESFGARTGLVVHWQGYAGAHVLWVRLGGGSGEGLPEPELVPWLQQLRQRLRSLRGEVVLSHAPRSIKQSVEVWGVEAKPLELMQEIKRNLDPHGILNPGRFVGRM